MIELSYPEEFALLTIRRPEALNALSFALIQEIGQAIDQAAQSSARALIITGAGERAFCAGADIKELQQRDLAAQRSGAEFGQAVFARLDRLPMASIALVNGFAFGGLRDCARLYLPPGHPERQIWPARDQIGVDPGVRGYAASSARCGPGTCVGTHYDGPYGRCGRGSRDRVG